MKIKAVWKYPTEYSFNAWSLIAWSTTICFPEVN
jgi:hypothetical protein